MRLLGPVTLSWKEFCVIAWITGAVSANGIVYFCHVVTFIFTRTNRKYYYYYYLLQLL